MTPTTIPMPLAVLAVGEEKCFCEVDCDRPYRVDGHIRVPIGTEGERALREVTVITRFDPEATAPWRPSDLALVPIPRRAALGLPDGSVVPAMEEAGYAGLGIVNEATPLRQALRPGEWHRSASKVFLALPPADTGG